jgi:hypothetical protein
MRYEVSPSHTDRSIHVICRKDEFSTLPPAILHLGPWQAGREGDIERLKPAYRAFLSEQGFVLVYRHPLEFPPEPD